MRQSKNAVLAIVFAIVLSSLGSATAQANSPRYPVVLPAALTTTPLLVPAHPTVNKAKAHRHRSRAHVAWIHYVHGRVVIDPVALGRHLNNMVFGVRYWPALYKLWDKESKWNPWERYGSACGIPQALPCSKIPNPSSIWSQIKWGLNYIKERYGNPAVAFRMWMERSSSGVGGWY